MCQFWHILFFYFIKYINLTWRYVIMDRNCNYLTSIAISLIISFVFALIFYTGIISNIISIFIFALAFALLSILLLGLFGISDNGITHQRLCQNCLSLIISIIGNILFNLANLSMTFSPRKHYIFSTCRAFYLFLYF